MADVSTSLRRVDAPVTFFFLCATWFLLLSIFHAFPELDIAASSVFFSSPLCEAGLPCGHFVLGQYSAIRSLRWALYVLPYAATAAIVAALAGGAVSKSVRAKIPVMRLWLSLVSLGLSTGLIVNLFLKSYSGRPRPIGTTIFGGQMDFMPAGSFLGQCAHNCSFVSGEASGAGWLLCLLILFPPRVRAWIGPPIAIASVATPILRVVVGAHYLSDAVLGWLISIVVFSGLLSLEAKYLVPSEAR